MDVAIHKVVWYVIRQKKDDATNSCTTQPRKIFSVTKQYFDFQIFEAS
jgi:hypothetical protein